MRTGKRGTVAARVGSRWEGGVGEWCRDVAARNGYCGGGRRETSLQQRLEDSRASAGNTGTFRRVLG